MNKLFDTTPARLSGMFTPHMVPVHQDGAINEAELRRYINWLLELGIEGLYPNGSIGEFFVFTPDERRTITRIAIEASVGRVPILAGVPEANHRETISACRAYCDQGVRAVSVLPPPFFRYDAESLYDYFSRIAEESPLNVMLYNMPMFASPIDTATIVRLARDCPNIIGLKDSSGDITAMMRSIAAVRPLRSDFAFYTGWDPALLPMLEAGCDGGINALSGIVPEATLRLRALVRDGQEASARLLQDQIRDLFEFLLSTPPLPEAFRLAVMSRGFDFGAGRQPVGTRRRDTLAEFRPALSQRINALLDSLPS